MITNHINKLFRLALIAVIVLVSGQHQSRLG